MTKDITEQELADARQIWGDALIAISKAFEQEGIDAARAVANDALDAAYGFELGQVLFKPTLASAEQTFRTTRDGALAYFVGHSDEYPGDRGFAIKGWRSVVCETAASFIQGDVAMWMGWVTFTDKNGNITKADKSWGYKKDKAGTLRIVLHHSSLPYQPE
ncbi:MAG: phosphoribosyl-AMP cyclohydrolase [Proteobacteria bacterium]|nr:phosphoribosyl-AMP cyclohydrolase [Pseudomonadota bacterium]